VTTQPSCDIFVEKQCVKLVEIHMKLRNCEGPLFANLYQHFEQDHRTLLMTDRPLCSLSWTSLYLWTFCITVFTHYRLAVINDDWSSLKLLISICVCVLHLQAIFMLMFKMQEMYIGRPGAHSATYPMVLGLFPRG
jgi:hypothetical protein